MDPIGAEVGTSDPYVSNLSPDYLDIKGNKPLFIDGTDPFGYVEGVTLDGMPMNQSQYNHMLGKLDVTRMILADVFRVPDIATDYPDQWDNPDFYKGSIWLALPDPQRAKPDPCVEAVVNATFRSIRDAARESVPLLLGNASTSGLTRAQAAYVLASAMGESRMGNQMTEGWGPTAQQKKYEPPSAKATQLGNTQKGDGYLFRGRGYVQITGRGNYHYWGNRLGIDLEENPDLALDPENAAQIAVYGMKDGTFTGQRLSDYINDRETDFVGARAIVNGSDRADTFAGYADTFLRALNGFDWRSVPSANVH